MTEVGVVPDDWQSALLDDVARRGSGHTPSKSRSEYWNGTIGWVSLRDSNNLDKTYIEETEISITEAGLINSSAILHPAGTVLLSRDAGVGKSSVMTIPLAVSQHFITWTCSESLNNLFLYHWLQLKKNEFERVAVGSTIKTIGVPYFKLLRCPVPSITEQQAIADALSDTDASIKSLDRLIAKKRQFKQGAMQQLLTGKQRLPGFDGKWKTKSMGELFSFAGGYTASRDQLSVVGHGYLHYGDIHLHDRTHIDVSNEYAGLPKLDVDIRKVNPKSRLQNGDIVFVDASEDVAGTSNHVVVSNVAEKEYIAGLHTITAKSKDNSIDHLFRRFCFQTDSIKEQFRFYAVGTKVSGMSKSNIAKVEMVYPPLPEQRAIARTLSDLDAELTALTACRDKAKLIKQGMMQELLTGKTRLV